MKNATTRMTEATIQDWFKSVVTELGGASEVDMVYNYG